MSGCSPENIHSSAQPPSICGGRLHKLKYLQNWLNIWSSACWNVHGKLLVPGSSDLLHGTRAAAFLLTLELPVHFVFLKAGLAVLSLTDQHRPVFSEALWNMLLHFIHTSRNKGRWILMWCSDRAYALNSSYFLNQKIAGFFWLYKGKSIGDGLTRRQPVREAKTDKKENALSDFSLNLQSKGNWETVSPEEMKTEKWL